MNSITLANDKITEPRDKRATAAAFTLNDSRSRSTGRLPTMLYLGRLSTLLPMNRPSRIFHVITRLDGYGGARMLRYLAARQIGAGSRVMVAALHSDRAIAHEIRAGGGEVHELNSRWLLDPIVLGRLARLVRRAEASIVHTWDLGALAYASMVRRADGGKLIASLSTWPPATQPAAAIASRAARRADALIVEDETAAGQWRRLAARPEAIRIIRPGVPISSPPPLPRADLLAQLHLPASARLIGLAGPLLRSKNIDDAIWAFELVRVLHADVRLVIFGDGPDLERLQQFAAQVSEPHSVQFAGYRGDLAALLPHLEVFWQLGPAAATPWALLEAEAAGVPVVASDLPAHRAAISNNQSGLLVNPDRASIARATDELLNNPEQRARLASHARAEMAARWSLDDALSAYAHVYSSLAPS